MFGVFYCAKALTTPNILLVLTVCQVLFTQVLPWSRHRDLNSGPLPYHGSALPLSYDGIQLLKLRFEDYSVHVETYDKVLRPRLHRCGCIDFRGSAKIRIHFESAAEGRAPLKNGAGWRIRTSEGISQQIYSLSCLTASLTLQY